MKKTLITIAIMIVCCSSIMAGGDIYVTKGAKELKSLWKSDGTAQVVIDWEHATWDKEDDLRAAWRSDWDFITSDCTQSFITGFNMVSRGVKIDTSEQTSRYLILFEISDVDKFFHSVIGWRCKLSGRIIVTDNSSGDSVYEAQMVELAVGRDYVRNECFGAAFEEIGVMMAAGKIKP